MKRYKQDCLRPYIEETSETMIEDANGEYVLYKDVKNLENIVKRLCLALRTALPENHLADEAMECLRKHDIDGSPMRIDNQLPNR